MTGWVFGVVWKIILDILPGKYMRYYYQTPKNLIKYNNILWLWFCETTLITEKYYIIFLWPSMSLEIAVCLLRKFIKVHIKLTEINSSFFRGYVELYMPLLRNCQNSLRTKIKLNNWWRKNILKLLPWIICYWKSEFLYME